ncbi:hypothetical protein SUGI_0918430 [Cryptomeria japonica]|nr:hypothetical protein SUGI_0918430 [Cryptomeria japonica]
MPQIWACYFQMQASAPLPLKLKGSALVEDPVQNAPIIHQDLVVGLVVTPTPSSDLPPSAVKDQIMKEYPFAESINNLLKSPTKNVEEASNSAMKEQCISLTVSLVSLVDQLEDDDIVRDPSLSPETTRSLLVFPTPNQGGQENGLQSGAKAWNAAWGNLRIEATKVFMQANCLMELETLPRRLKHLNSRHDLLHSEFLRIEVREDRLPDDIRWLRGVFNTLYSILRNIVKVMENERKEKELLEGLPIVTVSDFHVDDGLFCGVCRDDFIWGEEVREIPCMIGHIFHSHCIWPWLEDHNTCPILYGK